MYGHGGHLGHVTWTIYIDFLSPFPRRLHIKFGFDWPSGLREKRSLKMVVIYMYIAPGQRQTTPLESMFFINTFIQSIESFAANPPPPQ